MAITPDGDGSGDRAALRFRVERPAQIELAVPQRKPRPGVVHFERVTAHAGQTTVIWAPTATLPARTYVTRLTVKDGSRTTFAGPVIRVRGGCRRLLSGAFCRSPGARRGM